MFFTYKMYVYIIFTNKTANYTQHTILCQALHKLSARYTMSREKVIFCIIMCCLSLLANARLHLGSCCKFATSLSNVCLIIFQILVYSLFSKLNIVYFLLKAVSLVGVDISIFPFKLCNMMFSKLTNVFLYLNIRFMLSPSTLIIKLLLFLILLHHSLQ